MIINSKVIDVVKAEKDKKYEKYWYNVTIGEWFIVSSCIL